MPRVTIVESTQVVSRDDTLPTASGSPTRTPDRGAGVAPSSAPQRTDRLVFLSGSQPPNVPPTPPVRRHGGGTARSRRNAVSFDLAMKLSRRANRVVVAVEGDLDVYTAPALRQLLVDLIDDQGNLLVDVDLSGVEFLGAAALRVLVGQQVALEARGGILALAGVRPSLCRVLKVTGLAESFTVRSDEQRHGRAAESDCGRGNSPHPRR